MHNSGGSGRSGGGDGGGYIRLSGMASVIESNH